MKLIKHILTSEMIEAAVMAIAPSAQAQSNAAIPPAHITPAEARTIAREVYIYGYPLVANPINRYLINSPMLPE